MVGAWPYDEACEHVVDMGLSTRSTAKRVHDGTGHGRGVVVACDLGVRLEGIENVRRSGRKDQSRCPCVVKG